MAAVVAGGPPVVAAASVVVPALNRSRSSSQKRLHEGSGERGRSESVKRIRTQQEAMIAKNSKILLDVKCSLERQRELFKGLSGNQLIVKQLEYLKRYNYIEHELGKQGGK